MHGNVNDRRALEREALRNVINQWNANRLDLFELSEPNEDLEFHGVMRFYFQDSGQKVATKCIRVASDATVDDVIGTLVEKFRPDMRMLSIPSYSLFELHESCPERRMRSDEKPLLVQLNWHVDDREGRFLLKNIDDKTVSSVGSMDSNASFRRKLSKREKKQLKKQEKLSRMKSDTNDNDKDGVAEKLYSELPETSFTRSISNPEAVMRRRRQQQLEKKLQQFRSKDGGPDTGGTLKIYGEALCKDVPYKTLLLSVRDCAGGVVREMLDKYGLNKTDPTQWCLVQVTQHPGDTPDTEYVLEDDECPLSILMNAPNTGSIMFHVRRRPADGGAPRKRKKKPGSLGTNSVTSRDVAGRDVPLLIELAPDGSPLHPGETTRTIRLTGDVMEVGSANGIALQLYGPHIQPRHCVITNTDGMSSLTPCHADALTYVNGQRIHQTTILNHGCLLKFGNSNTYRFIDPCQEDRERYNIGGGQTMMNENTTTTTTTTTTATTTTTGNRLYESRSPRALSPSDPSRENIETTFDLEGNIETISTTSGARDDIRSLGSASENRMGEMSRFPRGQDPILPAVLEFPEEPQEQFLARVITHLDVTTPTFRLAPAYTLYLCARYRASTHYRPELTPTERAQKLTILLQHATMLVRHTVQDRSTDSVSQAFWLANASELLHFLKSDRHVSAFSLQAQDTLSDAVQLAFKNLVACLTDELVNNTTVGGGGINVNGSSVGGAMAHLMSIHGDEYPREICAVLSGAMNLIRSCRVNAALTIQLFSQLFHWISAKAFAGVVSNAELCTRAFGVKLLARLRNIQPWAESQGLEFAAECHLAKIVQCAHLLQAPKYTPEDLANLSANCFKLNSVQLGTLLRQYKPEPGERLAPPQLLAQATKAAETVADDLARDEGREVVLYEDPAPNLQLLLPDDGFSSDVVQGVPPGLADFLHPLQSSGLCRLAAQPTSSGHWTVYMSAPRPPSALSTTQPEVQMIRLHKTGGGMGLSIVAAKGAGQERLGIYIKSVVPGGAADRDGRLAAGDQLLSVDGQSLLGITQEKAAEFLVCTGSIVTLEVAKGGAVYHGLATLLQQPSPTPHRGPRRMSERDLPSRVNAERTIPSSKSVPALHHISPNAPATTHSATSSQQPNAITPTPLGSSNSSGGGGANIDHHHHSAHHSHPHLHHQRPAQTSTLSPPLPPTQTQQTSSSGGSHDIFNPGYSRTSSSNSINTNNHNNLQIGSTSTLGNLNAAVGSASGGMRSRSAHNLLQQEQQQQQQQQQQDGGFYQNLSVYRNKLPSPQQLGDRTSALRSSQNSLQSTSTNSQRPSSAYYPPSVPNVNTNNINNNPNNNAGRLNNMYQSIPNLKSPPPSTLRLHSEVAEYRTGSYPSVNQQQLQHQQHLNYHQIRQQQQQEEMNKQIPNQYNNEYKGYYNSYKESPTMLNKSYHSPTQPLMSPNNYLEQYNNSNNNSINSGQQQQQQLQDIGRYQEQISGGNGTLMMRGSDEYSRHSMNSNRDDVGHRYVAAPPAGVQYDDNGMMSPRGDDQELHLQMQQPNELVREMHDPNSRHGLVKMSYDPNKRQPQHTNRLVTTHAQPQQTPPHHILQQQQQQQQHTDNYYPQPNQQPLQSGFNYTQSMQNLSLNSPNQHQQNYQQQKHFYHQESQQQYANNNFKSPPTAPKPPPNRIVQESIPEPPPSSTHPLYSASSNDPPKMTLYPAGMSSGGVGGSSGVGGTAAAGSNAGVLLSKPPPRDPWLREEQERQAEVRREVSRQWQDQQIRELLALQYRTPQQDEQLKVLQLEREFQRRAALEVDADDQDDDEDDDEEDDTEKENHNHQKLPEQHVTNRQQQQQQQHDITPASILKQNVLNNVPELSTIDRGAPFNTQTEPNQQQQQSMTSPSVSVPSPPERGSSFAVMSRRSKDTTVVVQSAAANAAAIKRVSFNDASANNNINSTVAPPPPSTLQFEETTIREDPNSFIRQAETMLASPTSPTDQSHIIGSSTTTTATPGVIGAQEVYKDPRMRRLAEQAQLTKNTAAPVPEKLSFKEKMKMFAMETGEQETPKDKSKISKAQREIDNLGTPTSSLVH